MAPASHYYIGGVLTDTWGRTTVPGLYACGETASTGIHGANRLASNSLLEGLVFGERTVRDLNRYLAVADPAVRKVKLDLADEQREGNDAATVAKGRETIGQVMIDLCGIVRTRQRPRQGRRHAGRAAGFADGSRARRGRVGAVQPVDGGAAHRRDGARLREESRGVHLRADFPERDDANWRRHSLVHRDAETGQPVVGVSEPVA